MRFKIIVAALVMAFAGTFARASLAEDNPGAASPPVAVTADPEVKKAAREVIEEALKVSHAAEIFGDLRRTLREVYIPAFRDAIQGNIAGLPSPDAKSAEAMAKVLTVMDYVRRASDELDVALSENREAMISDAAEQIAKTAKPVEIKDIQNVLQLPAVRKGMDAFYAISKLLTGFNYGDTKTFSAFSAWASQLDVDPQQMIPGIPGAAVPSKKKIAKAQAMIDDLISISHLDEMVTDVKRFVREVYAETAPMPEEDREALRDQTDQYEFMYNMQKVVILAAAPSAVAAALTDEQLAQLHGFVRSPSFMKIFDLLRNAVKSSTAFTKEDILEAQKSFEDLENKAKLSEKSPAEQERSKTEWDALADKWTERLKNRISPETRSGLEKSLEDLNADGSPI